MSEPFGFVGLLFDSLVDVRMTVNPAQDFTGENLKESSFSWKLSTYYKIRVPH